MPHETVPCVWSFHKEIPVVFRAMIGMRATLDMSPMTYTNQDCQMHGSRCNEFLTYVLRNVLLGLKFRPPPIPLSIGVER